MNLSQPLCYALLLCLSGTLLSCDDTRPSNVEYGNQHQILHKGNGGEPQEIDPHVTTGMPEYRLQMALFEGLLSKHPQTLEPVPAVAESWSQSDDGLTYRFYLRKNARWSNGEPVTAQDFVFSWKRALLPALGNQYAYSLYTIKNAEKFHKGELADFDEVGIAAIDDHTLKIQLSGPTPYFLQLLDHHSMYPVHRATIEKFGQIDERGSHWTRPGNLVGNGPFILKEWTPNKVIIVEKNPLYWDAGAVRLNAIHFYPVQEIATEERMFRSQQIHITESVPEEKILVYKKEHPHLIRTTAFFGTYFYRFNTTIKPLDDARIRRALAISIDRQKIVERITKGGQIPAYNLTPPNTLGYTATAKLEFNIEKARALLAEAGYPNGAGFPRLEILYNTTEGHRKIATAIQQMWKTALNIDVSLLNQDWKVFLNSERTMNYQISRASWIGDYLDPNTFLDMFVTGGGNNKTGWGDPQYDRLIAEAAMTGDQQQRYALFQQAEKMLIDDAVIAPIYTYTKQTLIYPGVKGWQPNILDYHPYKYVYLENNATP